MLGTSVSDDTLALLREMRQLETLRVERTLVTGSGLANLEHLARLKTLDLGRNAITDAGLANLGNLSRLEIVYLHGNAITDAGFSASQGPDAATLVRLERERNHRCRAGPPGVSAAAGMRAVPPDEGYGRRDREIPQGFLSCGGRQLQHFPTVMRDTVLFRHPCLCAARVPLRRRQAK